MARRSKRSQVWATLGASGICVMAACTSTPVASDAGPASDVEAAVSTDVVGPVDAPADASVDAGSDVGADAGSIVDAVVADAADAAVDAGVRPRTGTLRDVQHVVIFAQENRSFDNYFGTLAGVRGFGDPAAASLRSGASVFHQPNGAGEVLPFHSALQCVNDVDHGWGSGHDAWHGGTWDRWIPAKGPSAMSAYTRSDLAYYHALADAYTTLDAYHCSVIGPTNPNRLYLMTGTIDPAHTGGGPVIDNGEPAAGFTWTTYPERLQSAGVSWRVYQAFDNFDDNALAWFRPFIQAHTGDPLYERGMRRLTDLVRTFREDVMDGTLPQVSWIVAPTPLSEHPAYAPASGEDLTRRVLEALAANPDVANSTVLFLTYDENGGFFDHVTPPTPPDGTADEFVGGQPIGFGSRVPMIVVSPWTRGGFVDSEVADHTSLLRFLEAWTGVREPNISAWRRQVGSDLMAAFDFAHPDFSAPTLPPTTAMNCTGATPAPPATQAIPAQEPGTRPTRALPYQPDATSRTDCSAGRFYIAMTNAGTAAVHTRIAANRFRTDGPWQYDVGPGGSVEDYFSVVTYGAGHYDLTLAGPDGFERQYAGDLNTACGALEASTTLHPAAGTVDVTYVNHGTAPVTFTTTAARTRTDGPWTDTVAAGATQTRTFDVTTMGRGWYALNVTASTDASFARRFAGHLQNGHAGVSGP